VELQVFQAMWAMEQLPWGAPEPWTLEERVARIADAGFAGLSISFTERELALRVCALAVEQGLRIVPLAFPTTVDELRPVLDLVEEVGRGHVDHLNLQPNVRPFTVDECVPFLEGWLELARDAGVTTYVETHRGRMTTDLLFTLQLLDAVPALELTADLSHYVVGRELAWPVDDTSHAQIGRILDHARAFHGRVATREQVQVQIGFPQFAQWVDLFAGWWREGFRRFRATAPADAVLTFTTELGPPGWYAITGADGSELSDRWEESLARADLARRLWDEAG
jgi:sugar phosphate isomerase/epimerase